MPRVKKTQRHKKKNTKSRRNKHYSTKKTKVNNNRKVRNSLIREANLIQKT
jgi:hypothetical protein